jgi:hypothetical protein
MSLDQRCVAPAESKLNDHRAVTQNRWTPYGFSFSVREMHSEAADAFRHASFSPGCPIRFSSTLATARFQDRRLKAVLRFYTISRCMLAGDETGPLRRRWEHRGPRRGKTLQRKALRCNEPVGIRRSKRKSRMNNLDQMLKRNKDFAAEQSASGTLMPSLPRSLPNVKAVVIGCADMRVDPAHVLGIKPGEAVVMRNIGGRITPGLLEQLSLLGRIGQVAGEIPGGSSAHRLRHHTPRGRPSPADALFSDTGRGTEDEVGLRSSHGGCRRRCCAQGDSRIAGRVACFRPRL